MRFQPVRFIRERQLTVWGSTPAAIAGMWDTRSLQPGALSCLRYSSFGGEPLPLESVLTWQAAAPNSAIDNFYGPTEATVDCVGQRVEIGALPVVTPDRGILAIGIPHPGTELCIFDQARRRMPMGEIGELAIAGGQLAVGYLDATELTAERYPTIEGKRWFFTGDMAYQDESGQFHFMGRFDNQIKIHGYRVELEDIEAHLRAVVGNEQVAAMAWPMVDGVAKGIVAFVVKASTNTNQIREALRDRLPAYMVPSRIHAVSELPRNAAGKVDRKTPIAQLDADKGMGNGRC